MRIVVAGIGEVGRHLAKLLAQHNHEIVAIDLSSAKLNQLAQAADLVTYEGSAISLRILSEAQVDRADLFIAVTSHEETNILSALLAKQIGARQVIARIDSNEYLSPQGEAYFSNMGIDALIYPEKLAAQLIMGLLGGGGTFEMMGFADRNLVLSGFRIQNETNLVGLSLQEIDHEFTDIDFRIVAITREGVTLIPHGDDLIYENDLVHIISTPRGIERWRTLLRMSRFSVEKLMVVGASRVGLRICLDMENSIPEIRLVERNQDVGAEVDQLLSRTLVIRGDGRDTDLLMREGLDQVDAFVAVTGNSETNILMCMAARRAGVRRIIAEVENIDYITLAESIGIDTVVNKKLLTASRIFRYTMGKHIASIQYLTGTDAEVAEFIVREGARATRGRLKDIHFPPHAIIGGIIRNEQAFIAIGDTLIEPGDRVIVFALSSAMERLSRFFG